MDVFDDGGMGNRVRSGYPSDVADEEWSFVAPYLALCREDAPQRDYPLRDVFAQVGMLAEAVQHITGESVVLAYVDQGYTGENAAEAAEKHGVQLEVVKHTEAKRGFVLLPRRWVVERSFAWAARFRRLARDYERLAKTLAALHYLAFAILMLANLTRQLAQS